MDGQHSITDWIANAVLMKVGYFTRLVFGNDKLTNKQLVIFYLFCGAVVFIVDKLPLSSFIRSSIILCCGLVIPNLIKGIISGAKKGQSKVEKKVENIIKDDDINR